MLTHCSHGAHAGNERANACIPHTSSDVVALVMMVTIMQMHLKEREDKPRACDKMFIVILLFPTSVPRATTEPVHSGRCNEPKAAMWTRNCQKCR